MGGLIEMRLIDADNIDFENTKGLGRKSLLALLNCLDSQPTAFDVDKIVNEIEFRRGFCKIHKGEEYSFNAGKWEAYSDAVNVIVDAVKKLNCKNKS